MTVVCVVSKTKQYNKNNIIIKIDEEVFQLALVIEELSKMFLFCQITWKSSALKTACCLLYTNLIPID